MMAARVIGLVVAWTLLAAAAFGQEAARGIPVGSCTNGSHEAAVSLRGAVVCGHCTHAGSCAAAHGARLAGCSMEFRGTDGRVFPLAKDSVPGVASLMGAGGVTVEVRGIFVEREGIRRLRVDQIAVLDEKGKAVKYPLRARCEHCGCRMQVDSAADAARACDVCPCKKTASECTRH